MSFPAGDGSGQVDDPRDRRPSPPRRRLALSLAAIAALFLLTPVGSAVAQSAALFSPRPPASQTAGSPTTGSTAAAPSSTSAVSAATAAGSGFVTRSGESLLLDGKPFTFVGFNINNANGRQTCAWRVPGMTVDQSLDAISGSGQVFRAWFFQALVSRGGTIDWTVFDHTLAAAAAHGEKVIAVLGNEWDTCDSGRYRDEDWYRAGYGKAPDGPNSPLSYTDWVKAVVSRYASNPTVMAWQLMNEPEDAASKGGSCSSTAAATLRNWVHAMAAQVKSIDPRHLLSVGTAGWGQCGARTTEYQALYADPNVDLCNYHDYANPSLPLLGGVTNGLGARVRQAHALGKPLIVDEMGIGVQGHGNGSLSVRAGLLDARLTAMLAAGIDGVLVWDFGTPSRTDYDVSQGDPVLPLLAAHVRR